VTQIERQTASSVCRPTLGVLNPHKGCTFIPFRAGQHGLTEEVAEDEREGTRERERVRERAERAGLQMQAKGRHNWGEECRLDWVTQIMQAGSASAAKQSTAKQQADSGLTTRGLQQS
jgi:hypothetical protein